MTLGCKTITDYPLANGLMPLLFSIRDCVPLAFEGLLLAIFILIFGGNYFIITDRIGRGRIFSALLSSSFATTILSLLLALAQLTTFITVVFFAFLTIVAYILLYVSDKY